MLPSELAYTDRPRFVITRFGILQVVVLELMTFEDNFSSRPFARHLLHTIATNELEEKFSSYFGNTYFKL